jgi:transposase InsO family protein
MKIVSGLAPGVTRLARFTADVSKQALLRTKWFDYYYANNQNARKTCRHFDISPNTFYRWKKRYDPHNLKTLEDRSRRAKHLRQPTYSAETVNAVLKLREEYPRWGKEKLAILLQGEGHHVSVSMVGRILKRLKDKGILKEPLVNSIAARKYRRQRPYAIRKPKEYMAKEPGDIVGVDTLDVRPLPGVIIKHFTARDIISRWDVLEAYTRATAKTAASFINTILERMPFPVRAIQVDGGSEFQDIFEEECQRRGIKLFVLPPRSPKLNGHVERAQRTHTEEFYEITDAGFDLPELNQALLKWEKVYNTIRPHQALGYLTPKRFLDLNKHQTQKEVGVLNHVN